MEFVGTNASITQTHTNNNLDDTLNCSIFPLHFGDVSNSHAARGKHRFAVVVLMLLLLLLVS